MGGYDLGHLSVSSDNPNINIDSGSMGGYYGEFRGETTDLWGRLTADYSTGNPTASADAIALNARLAGSLSEKYFKIEGDFGGKVADFDGGIPSTLTVYGGLGYRDRKTAIAGFDSVDYTWYYGAIGINYVARLKRLTFGVDGAVEIPFSPTITWSVTGFPSESTSSVTPNIAYRVELPITFDVYKTNYNFINTIPQTRVFLFTTPYWQYWKIPAYDIKFPDGSEISNGAMSTNIYGARVGVGVTFE